ncbi:hypothetical protein [Endozoicomonas sp. YOMI1]|uniref:hypothetical protein n=1 Tax=Endozoicomonas sp. YOMI1 TaxID=2828739 RepID=UPI002147B1E6|nr:hypothetical protein [Endozoicomonas sp. YOMI1]
MRWMRNWLLGSSILFLTTLAYGAATESPISSENKVEALQVVLQTSKGDMVLMLAPEEAPILRLPDIHE